jgi:hypothetical protein
MKTAYIYICKEILFNTDINARRILPTGRKEIFYGSVKSVLSLLPNSLTLNLSLRMRELVGATLLLLQDVGRIWSLLAHRGAFLSLSLYYEITVVREKVKVATQV